MISKLFKIIIGCILLSHVAPAQTQGTLNQRAKDGYEATERELNQTYQALLKQYAADTVFITAVRVAQRTWIKFRDAELAMMYPAHHTGGSALPMCKAAYLETLTRQRISTLRQWVDGMPEGDLCQGSIRNK